jgi:predicted site-specific integrase-resolvase
VGLLGEESTLRLLGEEAPKGRVAIYARVSSAIRKKIWRGRSKLVEYAKSKGLRNCSADTRWMQELPFTPKALP